MMKVAAMNFSREFTVSAWCVSGVLHRSVGRSEIENLLSHRDERNQTGRPTQIAELAQEAFGVLVEIEKLRAELVYQVIDHGTSGPEMKKVRYKENEIALTVLGATSWAFSRANSELGVSRRLPLRTALISRFLMTVWTVCRATRVTSANPAVLRENLLRRNKGA